MKYTIFDPSVLFISDEDWKDDLKRDEFLEHLIENIDIIDKYKFTMIYWSDELEEFFWLDPLLPWRRDRSTRMLFTDVLYSFSNNCERIDCHPKLKNTFIEVSPHIKSDYKKEEIFKNFLSLIHYIIDLNKETLLCLGIKNRMRKNTDKYHFSCECHPNALTPYSINKPEDFLNYIDIENKYWPKNMDEKEIKNFRISLEIMRLITFPDKKFLFNYKFARTFIKDIIDTEKYRDKILKNMVKLLISTKQEAASNPNLKNEYIEHKKEYRFRVTQRPSSTRIHYIFNDQKILIFKNYYREGKHDDGL